MLNRIKNKLAAQILKRLGQLPFTFGQRVGVCFGFLIWLFSAKTKTTTLANLNRCLPQETTHKKAQIARRSIIHTTLNFFETAHLWHNNLANCRQLIRNVEGEELLKQALETPQGLLLLLPHLGNWEIINHYITMHTAATALYRPAKLAHVDQLIHHARSHSRATLVPTSMKGVRMLYECLSSGKTVVILPDQTPQRPHGQFVPFFSNPAYTSPLAVRLLQKTKAQCLCIFSTRLGIGNGFAVHIISPHPMIYHDDTQQALLGLNHSIENCVNYCVEQYQWTYNRFKYKPTAVEAKQSQFMVSR